MTTYFCVIVYVFWSALMIYLNCETINRTISNDYSSIECTSFPCIINCIADSSCRTTNISCPLVGDGICSINVYGIAAGCESIINTGSSTNISINAAGGQALYGSLINSNTRNGSKLTINALGTASMQSSTLKVPIGKGSELTMKCGDNTGPNYICANMMIYDHYLTNINLQSNCDYCFYQTIIKNIYNTTNNYDYYMYDNYRGSVNIYVSNDIRQFQEFKYYGTDHGNWIIESHSLYGFYQSIIYADHSFITNNSYNIFITGLTTDKSISELTLYASQNNVNIKLNSTVNYAFHYSTTEYFQLICNSHLPFIINKIEMISNAYHSFMDNSIDISHDIRYLTVTGKGLPIGASNGGFTNLKLKINATILNDAIFNMHGDYLGLDGLIMNINRINGNLAMINDGDKGFGFYDSSITINNGVGGNITLIDMSTTQGQAFEFSDITINGNVGGNVVIRDDTTGTTAESFYGTEFVFENVTGNIEFVENGTGNGGISFFSTRYDIDYVGGNLLFHAAIDNGAQSFDGSNFNIGIVKGNLSFISNTYGAFSEGVINIKSIGGIGTFYANASNGYDFYAKDFNITSAPIVEFYANAIDRSFRADNFYFGSDVGIVNVIINDIVNGPGITIYATTWHCRNCDEFHLKCLNYADCSGSVKIYCPQNNKNNQCTVECDANSLCDDIDIYTTNGYCNDVRIICTDEISNGCNIINTNVYCTHDSLNNSIIYGSTTDWCDMVPDNTNNDQWICRNAGDSLCVHSCNYTDSPTNQPTNIPTIQPTLIPTIYPSFYPTIFAPITENPTSANPTTSQPISNPTLNPSFTPTTVTPTTATPTIIIIPTVDGSVHETTSANNILSMDSEEFEANNESIFEQNMIIFIILICGTIICIILLIFYIYIKRKKKQQNVMTTNITIETEVEIGRINSVSTVNEQHIIPNSENVNMINDGNVSLNKNSNDSDNEGEDLYTKHVTSKGEDLNTLNDRIDNVNHVEDDDDDDDADELFENHEPKTFSPTKGATDIGQNDI